MITPGNGTTTYQKGLKWRLVKSWGRHYIKNVIYISRFGYHRATHKNVLYFIFLPNRKHPGLADRLKATVSAYNIAKANGYDFKLFWETPFKIQDYLKPKFDWVLDYKDIEYSFFDTHLFRERFDTELIRLIPNKQYHCISYEGHDIPRIFPNTGKKWCDAFYELFEPSDHLNDTFLKLNIIPKTYVSCHLRMVNALEHFEDTFFDNHLESDRDRDALILRCRKGIQEVIDANPGLNVFVFSDSKLFLDSLSDMNVIVLSSQHVNHISLVKNDDEVLKTFLDLFIMSKGCAVYRFCAPELYSISHYALLAATIGDIPFFDQTI